MLETLNWQKLKTLELDLGAELVPQLVTAIRLEIATTARVLAALTAKPTPDFDQIREHAHRVKAACESVGMEHMAFLCKRLEYAARDRDLKEAKEVVAQLPDMAKTTIEAANKYLQERGG